MQISKRRFSILYKLLKSNFSIIILLFVVCCFFWKFFLRGLIPFAGDMIVGVYPPWTDYPQKWGYEVGVPVKNPITADVPSFIYPMQMEAVHLLKKGEMPLWNRFILGGTPLLANFQSAPYSPLNLLHFLLNEIDTWTWQIILQHFLAALFTYVLLRSWKISKTASIFGGILFAFSGFNLIWSQWNGHAFTASIIPLLIYFQKEFLNSGKIKFGLGFSLGVFIQILGGYPQVVMYTVFALALYLLLNLRISKDYFIKIFLLGLFGLVGIGLAAPQLLPGAELLRLSQRESEPLPFDVAFLPFQSLITFIAPDYFGNHATGNYWGTQDYTATAGFIGVLGVVFALIGILNPKRNKYLVILLLLFLALSLPSPLSIYIWKSGFLGLQAASAHRALSLVNLASALLAAYGLEFLLKRRDKFTYPILFSIALILGGYVFYSLYQINREVVHFNVAFRNLIMPSFILVTAGVLILLIKTKRSKMLATMAIVFFCFYELFRFGWKYTPFTSRDFVFPTTPEIEYLQSQEKPFRTTGNDVIPINFRMAYGIESLEGYDAVYPSRTSRFTGALGSNSSAATAHGRYGHIDNKLSPLLNMANVEYVLALKKDAQGRPSRTGTEPTEFKNQNYQKVFEGPSTVIYKNMNSLPRAFMVYDWEVVKDEKEVLDKLLQKSFPFSERIILEEDVSYNPTERGTNTVTFLEYSSTYKKISVETSTAGLLFISDTWYPGWKAYVNGVEHDLLRANYLFEAVDVLGGNNIIELRYVPNSFVVGNRIFVFSLVIFICVVLVNLLIPKKDIAL